MNPTNTRVFLDLTHLGRHVTGIERVSIEQFERANFEDVEVIPVRSKGVLSMILRQQFLLPLYALLHPRAVFVFPGFPPSPFFSFIRDRVLLYVHDTFLITRRAELSTKARLYMAPQFAFAVRRLKHFMVNSRKTRSDLAPIAASDADIRLYRPSVSNVFGLTADERITLPETPTPLRLATLGTVEPRKNYKAALAILDVLRKTSHKNAELHIIGRAGWGEDASTIASHPGVFVHGYLPAEDVSKRMSEADIYLCTSHDEGLGLPLLEAQYSGMPVVAPDQPVFREVLGMSGTFIDPTQPDAAAAVIAGITGAAGWRQKFASASLDNIRRWNSDAESDLVAARRLFAEWRVGGTPHKRGAARAS